MENVDKKKRIICKRTLVLALLAALLLGAIPVGLRVRAAPLQAVDGIVTLVEWKRVRKHSDMPTLADGQKHGTKWYYAMFSHINKDKENCGFGLAKWYKSTEFETRLADEIPWFPMSETFSDDTRFDVFLTAAPDIRDANGKLYADAPPEDSSLVVNGNYLCPMLRAEYCERDHETQWIIRIPFYFKDDPTQTPTNGREFGRYFGFYAEDGNKFDFRNSYDCWDFKDFDEKGDMKIHFDDGGKYAKDLYWQDDGSTIQGENENNSGDYFSCWLGEPKEFSAITHDYTVPSGRVLNIDDQVILMDGVTLTVEPGAVVSVNKRFFNNGRIVNYGTIYIQEDACMMPYGETDDFAGQIVCCGGDRKVKPMEKSSKEAACGDIVINKNGRLNLIGEGRLYLQQGASLVNNGGVVLLRKQPVISNAYVLNTEGSQIFFGKTVSTAYKPLVQNCTPGSDVYSMVGVSLTNGGDQDFVFQNGSKFVNYGLFYSLAEGVTPLIETRGNGMTRSYNDTGSYTSVSSPYQGNKTRDTYESPTYNETSAPTGGRSGGRDAGCSKYAE